MTTIEELDARFYRDREDEHARFDRTVRRYLRPESRVLDAGAGRGRAFTHDYARLAALVVGVDLDDSVRENTLLHAAAVADIECLPFRDAAFDLVLAKYVFEHLDRPLPVLLELRRVLRPGGYLVFHTPNRFHYVAVVARVSPHRFHLWFNRKRGLEPEDVHRVHYRANDRFVLARLARRAGFRVARLELFEPKPAYLFFNPLAYRAGIAYERLVSRHEALRDLRANLIGAFEAIPSKRTELERTGGTELPEHRPRTHRSPQFGMNL